MKKHSRRMLGIALTVGGAAGALGLLAAPQAVAAASGADLSVAKAGPALENAGDAVKYEIVVTNYGPDASTGWTLTDQVPTGLLNASVSSSDANCGMNGGTIVCQGGGLAANSSAIVYVTGTAGPNGFRLTNTVTVDGADPDPYTDNNVSSANTNILAIPMIDPTVGAATAAAAAITTTGVVLRRRRRIGGAAL
ncbi:DUF11 domain-containing protein [Streptomyces sp. NPDC007205]|uniref:DUF11 domain-containing protein n=1 Tax=Streptomyces sp. NPDC007205 TaxID=3154316 RepID=UPI0034023A29